MAREDKELESISGLVGLFVDVVGRNNVSGSTRMYWFNINEDCHRISIQNNKLIGGKWQHHRPVGNNCNCEKM